MGAKLQYSLNFEARASRQLLARNFQQRDDWTFVVIERGYLAQLLTVMARETHCLVNYELSHA